MKLEAFDSKSSRPAKWLLLSLLFAVSTAMRPVEKLSVYVEAELEEDEHSGAKNKDVLDSTKDLKNQIDKRGDIMLTQERASADIVVTVLDRRIDVAQDRQTHWGGGHIQNQYMSRYVIVYRMEAADNSHRAEQMAYGSLVTWKSVASNLSKHIEGWARQNRDQLLAWRLRKTSEK
jgi:hypothetical protein